MNRPSAWFERKFEFSFPVDQYPNLCVRLRGTPARLEEMVRGADRDSLARRSKQDEWSAQEHAGHLLDLESLWMARVDDYLRGAAQLTVADLRNQKTFEAHHNERAIDEILAEYRSARSQLVSRVANVEPSIFALAIPHPRLKIPMRLVDHLYFVAEHDDHHLAHILERIDAG